MFSLVLVFFVVATFSAQANSEYTGYKVLSVKATTSQQLDVLLDLRNNGFLNFWTDPSLKDDTDIMVSPKEMSALQDLLTKNGMTYTQTVDDVETLVKSEKTATARTKGQIDWKAYYGYDDITNWLDELPALYPKLATVMSIGKSFEGRDVKLIKISNAESKKKKVGFFLDACFHAREWIACSTVTYFINDILTKPNEYNDILSYLDFYIVPVVNPDGYEFTRTNHRMWRKTRSINFGSNYRCPSSDRFSTAKGQEIGVDLNRNFDQKWGVLSPGAGISTNPCAENYIGPAAFSEIEGRNIRDFILNNTKTINWKMYISVHCRGQWILIPWGGSLDVLEDFKELVDLRAQFL